MFRLYGEVTFSLSRGIFVIIFVFFCDSYNCLVFCLIYFKIISIFWYVKFFIGRVGLYDVYLR